LCAQRPAHMLHKQRISPGGVLFTLEHRNDHLQLSKLRNATWIVALAGLLLSVSVQAQQGGGSLKNIPVTGTADGGTFAGRVSITQLSFEAGQLVASGVVRGDAAGQRINEEFSDVPMVLQEGGTPGVCDILFLDLGPLSLDLLGLTIDLSQIILDINAVPGPGNLLGNLPCALVGLLDNFAVNLQFILQSLLDAINELL
jgi:hypothetical protein